MGKENKTIQLEQKIIHLKSEIEKYRTMLASSDVDEQIDRLKQQIEQLDMENDELKIICHHHEQTVEAQAKEINRLLQELEQIKNVNQSLHLEMQNNYSTLMKRIEMNEHEIASYQQKQIELEKVYLLEKESAHNELLENYQLLQTNLTSWIERIKAMEKDYNNVKQNNEELTESLNKLEGEQLIQTQEMHELKAQIDALTEKFIEIENMLSIVKEEQQKDIIVLHKQLLHQHVEIESLLKKTAQFTDEMEKIMNQLTHLTGQIEQKKTDSNQEIHEVKGMVAQIIRLLEPQQQPITEKKKEITAPKTTATPPSNSFLKLQQFIDETNQSIVVSPINQKKQGLSQKPPQVKRARIEPPTSQHTRSSIRYMQTETDDDQLPNLINEEAFHRSFLPLMKNKLSEKDLFVSLHYNSTMKTDEEKKEPDTAILEKNELGVTVASDIVQTESVIDEPLLYTSHSPLPSETSSHEEKKKSWLLSLLEKAKPIK
ncbi:MAG: hypothetical protein K6T72_13125 [Anoxybacillus sp.]|nr:hypothetical protein [Anoxybacillus sp.]MCL6587428.1 hypothetical protein [Anoxybacillus sp.]